MKLNELQYKSLLVFFKFYLHAKTDVLFSIDKDKISTIGKDDIERVVGLSIINTDSDGFVFNQDTFSDKYKMGVVITNSDIYIFPMTLKDSIKECKKHVRKENDLWFIDFDLISKKCVKLDYSTKNDETGKIYGSQ